MGLNMIFLLTFSLFFWIFGVVSNPLNSIFNEMKNDNKICKTPSFLYNSSYTSACRSNPYPDKPLNISQQQNYDSFLCMAVYDMGNLICFLDSKLYGLKMPNTTQSFDKQVGEANKLQSIKCSSWWTSRSNETYQIYDKLAPFVSQLYTNWEQHCLAFCSSFNPPIKPLCQVLIWAENNLQILKKTELTTKHLTGEPDVKNKPSPTKSKITKPHVDTPPVSEDVKKDIKGINKDGVKKGDNEKPTTGQKIDGTKMTDSNKKTKTESIDGNKPIINEDQVPSQADLPIIQKKKDQKPEKTAQSEKNDVISDNTRMQDGPLDYNLGNEDINVMNGKEPLEKHKEKEYPSVPTNQDEEESHFFTYFSIISLLCIVLYISFHNKQKILAIFLEGRRSRRGRNSRRRPSTANYRKLDCTLEEAVTSQCNSNVTHVIY